MIPFAEWSRGRAAQGIIAMPVEARPLYTPHPAEDEDDELAELAFALAESAEENARLVQIAQMQSSVTAECEALAGQLGDVVQKSAQEQAATVVAHVNGMLRPWIGERISEKAVEAFAEEVTLAFGRKLGAELVCQVPDGLRDLLAAALEKHGLKPSLEPSPDQELHAVHGESRIESTVSLWQEKLARLIA